MFPSAKSHGLSTVRSSYWGRRAQDWFSIQEPQSGALYEILLKALNLTPDTTLLDAGCGSGYFCALAAQKDSSVMGLDVSEPLLDLARSRTPTTPFFSGDMEALPFVDLTFDVVTMISSLQHVSDPSRALKEARRVLRPGGRIAVATMARPEQCRLFKFYQALDELLPAESPCTRAAFAYSSNGALSRMVTTAGFTKLFETVAITSWNYPDEDTAVRGLLSIGAAARAADCAGEERVREVARRFIQPYRLPRGGYRFENVFLYLIAQRH